jgi:hypothetical protein
VVLRSGVLFILAVAVVATTSCKTTSTTLEPAGQTLAVKTSTTTVKEGFFSSDEWVKPGTELSNFDGYWADAERVDELTFFHVAGDKEREAAVLEWREKHNRSIAASWGLFGVGIAVVGAGAAMFTVLGADDPDNFTSTQTGQVSVGLMAAGGIVVGMGAFGADLLFGPKETLRYEGNGRDVEEYILFPLSEAMEVSNAYNAKLKGAPAEPDSSVTEGTDTSTGG